MTYLFFYGHSKNKPYKEFSNFYLVDFYAISFSSGKVNEYFSSEQYLMSEKALLFGDSEMYEKIMKTKSPSQAKKYGRQVSGFNEKIWNEKKEKIMTRGLFYKFSSDEELYNLLTKTKNNILVEASPFDKVWGIGLSITNNDIHDPKKWKGKNLLGKCLMNVRKIYMKYSYETFMKKYYE